MCLNREQTKALIEVILGFFGISTPEIFKEIFMYLWKSGNNLAIIGWITAIFISILSLANGIAILVGYENLKDAWNKLR
jgi:hypothetical protein